MTDQAKTRYRILRSVDDGESAEVVGVVVASSADQALRRFFTEPPRDESSDAWYAATNENAMRWRQVAATVKTTIREASTTETSYVPEAEPVLPV